MNKCPACKHELVRENYEGTPVWRCPSCRGVLLPSFRLEIIKHTREKSDDALQVEAKAEFRRDTTDIIPCPECGSKMDKTPIARRYLTVTMDVCPRCDSVWLDGGELAFVQAVFEASTRGRESQEFQRRMQELEADPKRKSRFDEAMANLPEDRADKRDELLNILFSLPS